MDSQNGTTYTTHEGENMILSSEEGTWWDPTQCIYKDGVTLCDKNKMARKNNECVQKGFQLCNQ